MQDKDLSLNVIWVLGDTFFYHELLELCQTFIIIFDKIFTLLIIICISRCMYVFSGFLDFLYLIERHTRTPLHVIVQSLEIFDGELNFLTEHLSFMLGRLQLLPCRL